MMRKWNLGVIAIGWLSLSVPQLNAKKAIEITVSSPTDPSNVQEIKGDNLVELFDQVVSKENQLVGFAGQPISATFSYLGVEQSIVVNISADARSAELIIPSTGLVVQFNALNPSALQAEIENYIKSEGSSEMASFRKEVNKKSLVGVTDGNPNSSTALLSRMLYRMVLSERMDLSLRESSFTVDTEFSNWSADGIDGEAFFARIQGSKKLSNNARLLYALPTEFRRLGQAKIFGGSAIGGLEYTIVRWTEEQNWSLRLTPVVGSTFRGSEDLGAGGGIWSYGINGALARHISNKRSILFMAQINEYEGIPMQFEGFELDSVVDQTIAKVGMEYACEAVFLPNTHLLLGASSTRFLKASALRTFRSFNVGLAKSFGESKVFSAKLEYSDGRLFNERSLKIGYSW